MYHIVILFYVLVGWKPNMINCPFDRTDIINDKQYTCNCYSIKFIDRVYFNKSHMSTNITSLYLPNDFRNNSRPSKEILVVNRPSRG